MLVTAAFAAAGAEAEHAAEGAFPPFDASTFPSQILWLVITFGVFYLFMQRVVIPRIGSILETRRDRIAQDLNEANRLKEEADQAFATYEQELADAKGRAHAIAQSARDAAKADADAERAKVEEDMTARIDKAEADIAAVKTEALAGVDAIASDTAAAIVTQLVGGKVTKASLTAAVKAAGEAGE